jgi:hypothetical protein
MQTWVWTCRATNSACYLPLRPISVLGLVLPNERRSSRGGKVSGKYTAPRVVYPYSARNLWGWVRIGG